MEVTRQKVGFSSSLINLKKNEIIINGEFSISVPEASTGSTLARHGRGGAIRDPRQPPEILQTRPSTAGVKQGKFFCYCEF